MSQLRAARLARDELNQFLEFERGLGIYITAHGFTDKTFAGNDNNVVFAGVQNLMQVLSDLGYQAFANSGTLLGLVRDRRLIDYDDDIDLAVVLSATNDADAAKEFAALADALLLEGVGDRETMLAHEGLLKLPPVDGFQVDLFPAYGSEDRYYIFPYSYGDLKRSDVLPLARCGVTGLPIPAHPEVVLGANYGDHWRVPDSTFIFPWTRQKRKFVDFLTEWNRENQ